MKQITNQLILLKQSFNLLKQSPLYIAVSALIDTVFLLVLGFVGSFLTSKAIPHLQQIAVLNQGPSPITSIANSDPSAVLSQQVQMMTLLSKVLSIFAVVILIFIILWIIFQGLNWFLANKCIKNKVDFKKYFLNFSIVTIIGSLLTAIIGILFFNVKIRTLLSLNPLINQSLINTIAILLLIIVLYFLFTGYAISHKYNLKDLVKNMFVLGVKDFKKIILSYLMLAILFFMANHLIALFSQISFGAMIISGIIIILPLIALSRVYLIKCQNF